MSLTDLSHLIVFEHDKLMFDMKDENQSLLHDTLVAYHKDYCPFFKLIRNGVQFCEYVGALQIGNTLIEILPKAEKFAEKHKWQPLLMQMIRTVCEFPVKDGGASDLKIQHNSVLDLYFELLVKELEQLLHKGLVKKYIREEFNSTVLKGKLSLSKHLRNNIAHRERFYIEMNKYSLDHEVHRMLFAALKLLSKLNRNKFLASRIGNLLLRFPEQSDIRVSPNTFDKIVYNRKTIHYKRAMEIAELILLNYHPDISKGRRNVLALLFDMNMLWEQFVLRVLQKGLSEYKVFGQITKKFWRGDNNITSRMRPDIVLIHRESKHTIILDTKWKNLNGKGPSPDDLRQMFVYHEYFEAIKVALVYPGQQSSITGQFFNKDQDGLDIQRHCHVIQIPSDDNFKTWKDNILELILELV